MRFPLAISLTVLLLGSSLHAAGPHGTQPGQPLTDTGYVALTDQVAQAIADTGAGFVRVNFRLGPYMSDTPAWYATYDAIVNRLRSRGLEVIALMTNEAWPGGQAQWSENAYETTGGNGWNPYLNNWCGFFLRAATHWSGKIRYWELWNEPDCLAVIHPSNFGALLANAYDLARTNNLPVEIISGGVCGPADWCVCGADYITATYKVSIENTGWFTQMKDKWGTYPLDHIGFHIYPNCSSYLDTTWLSRYFQRVRNAYATYEGSSTTKKMWLTEVGWQTAGSGCKTTEAIQAANLTSMMDVANGKPYIKHVNWFFLKDEPAADLYFGVFRPTGLNEADKKPAWTSLKTASTYEGRWSAGGSINQPILDYFNAKGHAQMGNPVDNGGSAWVHNWTFGPVQDYEGGTMGPAIVFDSANGVGYATTGPFRDAALAHHTALEFPLGDKFSTDAGERQDFEGGCVTWSQTAGTEIRFYDTKLPLDNSDSGFAASGSWSLQSASDAYSDGKYRRRSATAANTDPAVWSIPIPRGGSYDVYARWPNISTASSSAYYEVVHASGTATVSVNQQERSGRWNRLGTFTFSGPTAVIRLSSQGDLGKYVLADAVRVVFPNADPDTTPPTTPVVTDEGRYTTVSNQLSASWVSNDPESGIERYEYAIGTSAADPGSGYVVDWTSSGTSSSVTHSLSLSQGVTYYFYVRAFNTVGLVSEVGVSDGITVDLNPPTRPTVTDDGDYTGDPSLLHCAWHSQDAESGIAGYQFSVGTDPYGTDVVPTTSVGPEGEIWVRGLSLVPETTYYFTVRALNGAGLLSTQQYSDGITCRAAQEVDSVRAALSLPDSTVLILKNRPISALFLTRLYITDPMRLAGLAVRPPRPLSEGQAVDVTGTMETENGERVLAVGCITPVEQ